MEYEKKIVVYMDILGFRDSISKSKINPSETYRINDALRFIHSFRNAFGQKLSIRAHSFSDHIVLSCAYDSHEIYILLEMVRLGALELAKKGFFVRGAAVVGSIVHDENWVFGPALVEAYEIESGIAFYPRIVTEDAVVQAYKDARFPVSEEITGLVKALLQGDANLFFPKCEDGLRRIEFFNVRPEELRLGGLLNVGDAPRDQAIENFREIKRNLETAIKDTKPRKGLVQLSWLAERFNDALKTAGIGLDEVMPIYKVT